MCITFMLYYPVKTVAGGVTWTCFHGFDFGAGCETQLSQADLSGVDELGRSFGTNSGECVAEPSDGTISKIFALVSVSVFLLSNAPNTPHMMTESPTTSTTAAPPTVGTPTSGTGRYEVVVYPMLILMFSLFMISLM